MKQRILSMTLAAGLVAACETRVDVLTVGGSDSTGSQDFADGGVSDPDGGPEDLGTAPDGGSQPMRDGGAAQACARLVDPSPVGGSWTEVGYVEGSTLALARNALTFAVNGYDPGDLLAMPPRAPQRNIAIFPHRASEPSTGRGLLDHPLVQLVGHDDGCPYTALSSFAFSTGDDVFPMIEARPIGTNCAPPESVPIRLEDEVLDASLIKNVSGLYEPRVLLRTTDGALWRIGPGGLEGDEAHQVSTDPITNAVLHDRTYVSPGAGGPRLVDARAVTFAESNERLVLVADTFDAPSVRWSFEICGAELASVAWLDDRMLVVAPCEAELVLYVASLPLDLGRRPGCERCELLGRSTVESEALEGSFRSAVVSGDDRGTIGVAFWPAQAMAPSIRFFDAEARPQATGRLDLPAPDVERGEPAALAMAGQDGRWAVAYAYEASARGFLGTAGLARFSTCEVR